MLQIENLSRTFGSKIAVDGISFSIKPGVITGLLGPNGAGKTTTMRLITGFLEPSAGKIEYKGEVVTENPDSFKEKLGYLPESAPLYQDMKVAEYLSFMADIRKVAPANKKDSIDKMVQLCELESKMESLIGYLSKGFKQRVALAGTLIHDPEIIILDEPTSGLDPNQISHVRTLIKNLGKQKTLILSTHILQEVEDICDEVIIIHKGKIVANSSVQNLHGGHKVLVSSKATLNDLSKLFSGNEFIGVEEFKEQEESASNGFQNYLIGLKEFQPELVFKVLSKANIATREIKVYKKSLESVFSDLTKN